jgi:AcrR family transcriptional regulator
VIFVEIEETSRKRNRRGEGRQLRAEILEGAARLVDQAGTSDAVTLRAVAREVGIAAPSIYAHFPDRDAIVEALMVAAFRALTETVKAGSDSVDAADPVGRLEAGCRAYLTFAADQPQRYRALFELPWPAPSDDSMPDARAEAQASFDVLVNSIEVCVLAGVSASTDVFADAVAIWAGLHGLAALRATHPGFPWPDRFQLCDTMVHRLARIEDPGAA